MKFILQGEISFSKDAENAREDLKEFIKEANSELLLRGVPENQKKEGAKITSWNIEGALLKLQIDSGHRVRAHDALLRIKKPLGELLGDLL